MLRTAGPQGPVAGRVEIGERGVDLDVNRAEKVHVSKATLGTLLGEIKNARHKFVAAIPSTGGDPIGPAEAMMRALWDGQTSRRGGQTPASPETLKSARAGVHLAATLLQWFVSGVVVRTP
ncbi:hypothetical protein ACFU5Y_33240 [Streptomyces gardneri]|uniref:hypothetical protein n=1 Tax=Streptomyces gardneri TaxID=66892 RepID=UPI00368AA567